MAARTPTTKQSSAKIAEQANAANEQTAALVEQLKAETEQLAKLETPVVNQLIRIGDVLHQLREAVAPKKWRELAAEAGYAPRVACRYCAIGKAWGKEEQTLEAPILEKMPTDLLKLEVLARLSPKQLDQLTRKVNLKTLSRKEVAAKVRELVPPAKAGTERKTSSKQVVAQCEKALERIQGLAKASGLGELDEPTRQKLWERVSESLETLQQALGMKPVAETPRPRRKAG